MPPFAVQSLGKKTVKKNGVFFVFLVFLLASIFQLLTNTPPCLLLSILF
jgi:hypothetical protein